MVSALTAAMRGQTQTRSRGSGDQAHRGEPARRGQPGPALRAWPWTRRDRPQNQESAGCMRVHRGVYAVVGRRLMTRRGFWMAAVLACGPGAVLSHRAAAALWGIRGGDEDRSHRPTGRRPRPGIRLHWANLPADEVTVHHGIPVTTIARTLLRPQCRRSARRAAQRHQAGRAAPARRPRRSPRPADRPLPPQAGHPHPQSRL